MIFFAKTIVHTAFKTIWGTIDVENVQYVLLHWLIEFCTNEYVNSLPIFVSENLWNVPSLRKMSNWYSPVCINYNTSTIKDSIIWYRYEEDTLVSLVVLADVLKHFSIHFILEGATNGEPPFVNYLVNRRDNGTHRHHVYRKPTHTYHYLYKDTTI